VFFCASLDPARCPRMDSGQTHAAIEAGSRHFSVYMHLF
jgi:hypothetical protein